MAGEMEGYIGAVKARGAIIVSYAGGSPFSPRAQRTERLAGALDRDFRFSVERLPDAELSRRWTMRGLGRAARPFAIDQFELNAAWRFARWVPQGEGALLIGWPFSPLFHAAKRLQRAGVPYVVDAGDPWALTAAEARHGLPWRRARAAESFLWGHAAGAVLTTSGQAARVTELFPDLAVLVRPNGYHEPDDRCGDATTTDVRADGELRLVHFGTIYAPRLPVADWLSRLRCQAGVESVLLTNYGHSATTAFEDPQVRIEVRPPVDWTEACQAVRRFDGALVIGNRDPAQLPSKAVQYLTLPIPRIALTQRGAGDELTRFAEAKPAFLAVDIDSPDDTAMAVAHLRRDWSASELSAPARDAWPEVEREIIEFVIARWARRPERIGVAQPLEG